MHADWSVVNKRCQTTPVLAAISEAGGSLFSNFLAEAILCAVQHADHLLLRPGASVCWWWLCPAVRMRFHAAVCICRCWLPEEGGKAGGVPGWRPGGRMLQDCSEVRCLPLRCWPLRRRRCRRARAKERVECCRSGWLTRSQAGPGVPVHAYARMFIVPRHRLAPVSVQNAPDTHQATGSPTAPATSQVDRLLPSLGMSFLAAG